MAFEDQHDPSIGAKVLLSISLLTGIMIPFLLAFGHGDFRYDLMKTEKLEGNFYRQMVMLSCCLIYFFRFTLAMFVFVKRKISWFEGTLVSFLFFMMFYLFGTSAAGHIEPIGWIDILGVSLFLVGSYINTLADYQRYAWKRETENTGLYTKGLFKYSMHVNYLGDSISYVGLALITLELVCLLVAVGIIVNFIVLQIPMLDKHLIKKYGDEFIGYAKQTKKFIPYVY